MIHILRGIPGSGKTHAINNTIKPSGMTVICSADHYFEDSEGNYNFNPALLNEAHGACLKRYVQALDTDCDIIVDNTNIRLWEVAPYVSLANAFEKDYEIIEIVCEPSKAAKRNTHGVPEAKILEMYKNYEKCLPWWKSKQVFA